MSAPRSSFTHAAHVDRGMPVAPADATGCPLWGLGALSRILCTSLGSSFMPPAPNGPRERIAVPMSALPGASLGQRLRAERERRRITLQSIAANTKINVALLQGLERDDASRWPSGIFRR